MIPRPHLTVEKYFSIYIYNQYHKAFLLSYLKLKNALTRQHVWYSKYIWKCLRSFNTLLLLLCLDFSYSMGSSQPLPLVMVPLRLPQSLTKPSCHWYSNNWNGGSGSKSWPSPTVASIMIGLLLKRKCKSYPAVMLPHFENYMEWVLFIKSLLWKIVFFCFSISIMIFGFYF